MSETKRDEYIVRGSVREGRKSVAGARVIAEIVDVDLSSLGDDYVHKHGLIDVVRTADDGSFEVEIPKRVIQLIRPGDKSARLVLQALTDQGTVGSGIIQISAARQPDPVVIRIGSHGGGPAPGSDAEPIEVQFSTEVLDAFLGIAGASGPGSGSPAATGAFDDRFFEERLRRLIGANVRSGDIAGLRREIDRVVVEEEVEGEKQFVFRGPGRVGASRATATAAYAATGSPPTFGTTGAGSYGSNAGGVSSRAAASAGTDNLAGPQAILYRRAAAELDQVRRALASLQPEDSQDSPEFESIRSLVDDALVDLVTAFGSELRPPVARVDGIFDDLLGGRDGGGLGGFVGRLGELAGFITPGTAPDNGSGNGVEGLAAPPFLTLAEEQEQTRFLELATYVSGLRSQWDAFRTAIATPTLNVRSTVLGRRIGFVADAVRELDLALETAPGDPGERQFEAIDRNGTTLDEYISWLNDFVADAQTQLRDGSTASFDAIAREAQRLANVAKDALEPDPAGNWPGPEVAVLDRRLVRRALEELRDNLNAIAPVNTTRARR